MKKDFSTSDLNLAATLVALGFQLQSFDDGDSKRVRFIFLKQNDIEKAVRLFWNDKLCLSPQTLFAAQRQLKARLHAVTKV